MHASIRFLISGILPALAFAPCAFAAFEDDLPYLKSKWRSDVTDKSTGLGVEELKAKAEKIAAGGKGAKPWCLIKAEIFRMTCEEMSVGFSPHDVFPAFSCWSKRNRVLTKLINERIAEVDSAYCPDAKAKAKEVKGEYIYV